MGRDETPGFPSKIRLPRNIIRSQYPHQGGYRPFKVIQGNTITFGDLYGAPQRRPPPPRLGHWHNSSKLRIVYYKKKQKNLLIHTSFTHHNIYFNGIVF